MAIFGPKPWVNPFGKMSIFSTFWTSCFYSLLRRFYVLEYHRIHFPGLHCVKKKVWKMSIFSTFWTSCFYSLKRRFYVIDYQKRHFPGLYCDKKKFGKMVIFGPKPWVNPFGKMSTFQLFELLVFIAYKGLFTVFQYHKRHFPRLYWLKKKVWKMAIFGPKPWVNPFRKMPSFRLFELLVFIAYKGVFTF